MEKEKLEKILDSHKKWLNKEEGGVRADLHSADLRYADLHNTDLRDADLRDADLFWADLHGADLRGANLRDAILRDADLSEAILSSEFSEMQKTNVLGDISDILDRSGLSNDDIIDVINNIKMQFVEKEQFAENSR